MYYVNSYYVKDKKAPAYQEWLKSDEALEMFKKINEESQFKYINTYWPIMGFGSYDCEDWWEVPDWAAFEKIRDSEALDKFFKVVNEKGFFDNDRNQMARVLRSNSDVKIWDSEE